MLLILLPPPPQCWDSRPVPPFNRMLLRCPVSMWLPRWSCLGLPVGPKKRLEQENSCCLWKVPAQGKPGPQAPGLEGNLYSLKMRLGVIGRPRLPSGHSSAVNTGKKRASYLLCRGDPWTRIISSGSCASRRKEESGVGTIATPQAKSLA